jgi:2-hydroxychromene-2-carboxylate isomerase
LFAPDKSVWLETERIDWAKRFDIPMAETLPEGWPTRSTIKVQRMLTALSLSAEEESQLRGEYVSAIQAIYTAFWVQRQSVHALEVFGKVLADVIGKEVVEEMRVRSESSKIRELLWESTREAFQDGAFGIPWIVAVNGRGERRSFWGFDRLGMVAEFLGFGTPVLISKDRRGKALAWPFHLL